MAAERSGLGGDPLDSGFSLLRSRIESNLGSDMSEDDTQRLRTQIH
jgi:hypothetical protein